MLSMQAIPAKATRPPMHSGNLAYVQPGDDAYDVVARATCHECGTAMQEIYAGVLQCVTCGRREGRV